MASQRPSGLYCHRPSRYTRERGQFPRGISRLGLCPQLLSDLFNGVFTAQAAGTAGHDTWHFT
jgi:hypothetical protein